MARHLPIGPCRPGERRRRGGAQRGSGRARRSVPSRVNRRSGGARSCFQITTCLRATHRSVALRAEFEVSDAQGSLRPLLAIGFAAEEPSHLDEPHDHSVAEGIASGAALQGRKRSREAGLALEQRRCSCPQGVATVPVSAVALAAPRRQERERRRPHPGGAIVLSFREQERRGTIVRSGSSTDSCAGTPLW